MKYHIDYYRAIHSFKTAVACLIGLIVAKTIQTYLQWQMGLWIPITIIVVMSAQVHFGAALQKAYMRFLGTVAGVIIALLTLLCLGDTPPFAITICIMVASCALFTYIASTNETIGYAGTLGGVTVILTLWGQETTKFFAIQRGIYITLGIMIAILISRFLFPIHARDILRVDLATTLKNLKKLYIKTLQPENHTDLYTADPTLDSALTHNIANQPTLLHEACLGSKLFAQKKSTWNDILTIEHRLHRLINLIYKSLREIKSPELVQQEINALTKSCNYITDTLANLAICCESPQSPECKIDSTDAFTAINGSINLSTQTTELGTLVAEHSLLFFIEQTTNELESLQKLITSINHQQLSSKIL